MKTVIHSVAFNIFGFDGSLEDSIRHYEGLGILKDLEDVQAHYFDSGGIFLVVLHGRQIVGSGGIRKLDERTGELKRMWLLEAYHRQGIGYRLLMELFDFARQQGYSCVRLQTSPQQSRALEFYRQVGFCEIPSYNDELGEISMEFQLRD